MPYVTARYEDRLRLLAMVAAMEVLPPPSELPEFVLDGDLDTCHICLQGMVAGERVRWLPCQETHNHAFHADCIDPWIRSHRSCPVCRGTW